MRTRPLALMLALALALTTLAAGTAGAHPGHGPDHGPDHATDDADDAGVLHGPQQAHHANQHTGEPRNTIDPRQENVEVLGQWTPRDIQPGRIADVAALGNHAYLGAFWQPDCRRGGVYVVDISNPAAPRDVAFINAAPGSYVGEGVFVDSVSTPHFTGDLLIYNNEICRDNFRAVGGATLVDVTNPRVPRKLVDGFGDFDVHGTRANQSHSAKFWQDGDNLYAVLVDNEEFDDVDIFDITDPRNPVLIAETGINHWPPLTIDGHGGAAFHHDMWVNKIGDDWIMGVSYWDGGWVFLNVNDPHNPTFIADTVYPDSEPFFPDLSPTKGNAHQGEWSFEHDFWVGTNEVFNPYRLLAEITDTGQEFVAIPGTDVPAITPDSPLEGPTRFVGLACDGMPVPAAQAGEIAVVERGLCTFTEKASNVSAAGYAGGIVFNLQDAGCEGLVTMLVEGDIPFLFVRRSTGLDILAVDYTDPCTTAAPEVGTAGLNVSITSVFQGWGDVYLYTYPDLAYVDTFAIPESLDPAFAEGYGDLSVHEVATDPDSNLGYLSYYAGGFRVIEFGDDGFEEVGAFVAEGGSNFWGVEVHEHATAGKVVLASDRDSGLWIFRYTGS
jgi:hypothetical protein